MATGKRVQSHIVSNVDAVSHVREGVPTRPDQLLMGHLRLKSLNRFYKLEKEARECLFQHTILSKLNLISNLWLRNLGALTIGR